MSRALLRPLAALSAEHASSAGMKAVNLGVLARAGFPVPHGVVLTVEALESNSLDDLVAEAVTTLGDVAVAVRSSGAVEDLPGASFAGQYETVLDVRGADAIRAAVERCRDASASARVTEYLPGRGKGDGRRMAVLVQQMVVADAAGVCLTANPMTGARGEVLVSAVKGLGERLVSGESIADEWIVSSGAARCQAAPDGAVREAEVLEIAALARKVEAHFGCPQDIEWAFADGRVHLLQARPMTALPEEVSWKPPAAGSWQRNFRLGEHLGEPLTPLFASWGIDRLEEAFYAEQARDIGQPAPPRPWHVVVNGWYFNSYAGTGSLLGLNLRWQLRAPRAFFRFVMAYFGRLDYIASFTPLHVAWRDDLLPRYQRLVADGERGVAEALPRELYELIDDVTTLAGACFWKGVIVGGWGWKCERVLAQFFAQHLKGRVEGSHQTLLCSLAAPRPTAEHAVQTLDWHRPTLGELGIDGGAPDPARYARAREERERAEAACREVLAESPKRLARFDALLAFAQRYTVIQGEMMASLTLGWPLVRRALLKLGDHARARGVIERAEDVFFLERSELEGTTTTSLDAAVRERRAAWERARRLTPPLWLGTEPIITYRGGQDAGAAFPSGQRSKDPPSGTVVGMPASPGRATGRARIVRTVEERDRLRPGDVLVAPVTTPAFTPLFARASAVVTDSGSLVAHAALVAREYGIPAVVATRDATERVRDGDWITVDGTAGWVSPQGASENGRSR